MKRKIAFITVLFNVMFIFGCKNFIPPQNNIIEQNYKSDSIYNEKEILQSFANILNDSLNKHRDRILATCRVENGEPKFFFVYDLVDTLNNSIDKKRVAFMDKHIYHFSTITYAFSYSNICILDGQNILVFKNINCSQSDNSIDDVLAYMENMKDEYKKDVFKRVENYRKYSRFLKMDNYTQPPDGCR